MVICCGISRFILLQTKELDRLNSGLFKRTVVDLGLNKIQTVSYNIPGIFGGMFGYGTLLIQTQVGDMMIKTVSRPEEIYNKLQNVIGE